MMINANTLPRQSSVKMEPTSNSKEPANPNATAVAEGADDDLEHYRHLVDEMSSHVKMLEEKVRKVELFYSNNRKKTSINSKNKEKVGHIITIKKEQDHTTPSESMQELMCQFGNIINQILQRKGVVDDDLCLHNCPEFDGKPKDFSAIKRRIEIKDGTGYNDVRKIYSDVRSVLKNAMKYNDERSDAHVTARTLKNKFEEKWLDLLPKVMQEEERIECDQDSELADHAHLAKDISGKLFDVEKHLNEVKELVLQKCRKMTTLEKRELGKALAKLSPDDLKQALEIVAQSNPAFQPSAEVVDLDIDAQSEYTLRMLNYFIKDVWQAREKRPPRGVGDHAKNIDNSNAKKAHDLNFKRKSEIVDLGSKSAKQKTKTYS